MRMVSDIFEHQCVGRLSAGSGLESRAGELRRRRCDSSSADGWVKSFEIRLVRVRHTWAGPTSTTCLSARAGGTQAA